MSSRKRSFLDENGDHKNKACLSSGLVLTDDTGVDGDTDWSVAMAQFVEVVRDLFAPLPRVRLLHPGQSHLDGHHRVLDQGLLQQAKLEHVHAGQHLASVHQEQLGFGRPVD